MDIMTAHSRAPRGALSAIGRIGGVLATLALAVGAAVVGLLAHPQPLYAFSFEEGRLSLHSDRPFDVQNAKLVLADVERRLDTAPATIRDGQSTFRIFISNDEWRRRLLFLWNYGAGGVNYYPLGTNVFLRAANVDRDRLRRTDGADVPPPRTLAYYAAHEIAHSFIGHHTGAVANWRLPRWIREGLADYVAFAGDVDIEALTAQLRAGDTDLDPQASGLYARYRLLVAYFLQRQGWSVDRLLASGMSEEEALRRLLADVRT